MDSHQTQEYWFSFGDCCLAVSETTPKQWAGRMEDHCLFFLHGRFGQAEMWRPLIHRLGSHFRCLRIDLPGFGRSFSVSGRGLTLIEQAELVQALLRRFSGGRAVLVGHDVGGAIAQLCTLFVPQSVSALVLINSASVTQAPKNLAVGAFCWKARHKLRMLFGALGEFGIEPEQHHLLSACWRDRARCNSMMRAFEAWEYSWPGPAERKVWREKLSTVSQPVLVLWGQRDPLHPPENADEMMRQFQDAHLFETEDCGHWPCLEKMDWVHTKLREFLFHVDEGQSIRRHVAI